MSDFESVRDTRRWPAVFAATILSAGFCFGQADSAVMTIDSSQCTDCHTTDKGGVEFSTQVTASAHSGVECLNCHLGRDKIDPSGDTIHVLPANPQAASSAGCAQCHVEAAAVYKTHGRYEVGSSPDLPTCASCHGSHSILPPTDPASKVYPARLPDTCGACHENLNLTTKYEMLFDKAVSVYKSSIHGEATQSGVFVAATCNDCHSTGGSAHRILSPADPQSSINHFNIPRTCGRCHQGVENEYWEGIHGRLVKRGETDSPVCTNCHGEHGILSTSDPNSPVSHARVAEATCSPCHDSVVLNEKYGLPTGRLSTFIDSYHGLKSKAGDPTVANCASCHGAHRILPSADPASTVNPQNLRHTCGSCHPGITRGAGQRPDPRRQGCRASNAGRRCCREGLYRRHRRDHRPDAGALAVRSGPPPPSCFDPAPADSKDACQRSLAALARNGHLYGAGRLGLRSSLQR